MYEKMVVGRYFNLPNLVGTRHKGLGAFNGFIRLSPVHLYLEESKKKKVTIDVRQGGYNYAEQQKVRVSAVSQTNAGAKLHRTFRFLHYIPGSVTCCKMHGADVITGPMSGCPLTRFTFGGDVYAGHVGTSIDSVQQTAAAKAAWNAFANANPGGGLAGFNPYNDWVGPFPQPLPGVVEAARVYALITPSSFYSMVCYQQNSDMTLLRIAGIQKINGMSQNQLLNI